MQTLRHIEPELRVFAGPDALAGLRREVARSGARKATIICGTSLGQDPLLKRVIESLGDMYAGTFTGVRPHTPAEVVIAAADAVARQGADALIAIGGGSAAVTARAVAIVSAEGRDITALATGADAAGHLQSPRLEAEKIPLFTIPTTPNTAYVKAGAAVLLPQEGLRAALYDPKTRSRAVFLDAAFLASAPPPLVRSAALDTLSLAVEGLLSSRGDRLAEAQLLQAIDLTLSGLVRLAETPHEAALRCDLALAGILCGRGSDHTGAGVATALGHALGILNPVDNGLLKAILLPHAIRFNAPCAREAIAALGRLTVHAPDAGLDAILAVFGGLYVRLGLPARLRDANVSRATFGPAAERAMKDWFLKGNPRPVGTIDELGSLLEAAW